ncbi:MAG: phage tail tape measure protein [Leptolyngbya sp. SIO3F4]|nr:phage tail tape measure protein [Leptolyngbya sp. SIO3F4]
MADLGELVLRMRLDSAQYERDLSRMRTLTAQFDRQFGGQNFSLGTVNTRATERGLRGFANNANTIITGAFLGIGNQIANILTNAVAGVVSIPAQAVGSFLDFESGLNQLAVVTRSSRTELEGVTEVIKQLGIETSKSPAEVIAAANALATLGQTPVEIQTNLPAVVALSEATRTDLELSADLIAKVGTVFGTSANEAADAITTLRNTSAALPQDVTFLLQQAGAVAASTDTQFTDLAAAFATLRDAGVNARPAATGLRNILQNLTPTTAKASGAIRALNLELAVNADTGQFVGFEQFLTTLQATRQEFIDSGAGLKAFNQELQIAFGKPGQAAVLGLLEQFTALDGAFNKNRESLSQLDGAAAESAQQLQVGLDGALKLLQGTVDTLLISFGAGLAPVIEAFARTLTAAGNAVLATPGLFEGLIQSAEQLKRAITGNPELIQQLAQSFIQLASSGLQSISAFFRQLATDPAEIAQTFNSLITIINSFAQAIRVVGAVLPILINVGQFLTDAAISGTRFSGLGLIIQTVANAFTTLQAPIQTITTTFSNFIAFIDRGILALQNFLGIARQVQAVDLSNVGQAGVAALGNSIQGLTARRYGGPVGPGGAYLVGEAPKVGPELGVFGNQAMLFTQPTVLPNPPSGRIYSPEKTRRMMAGPSESTLVAEIKALRSQIGRIREVLPMLDALSENLSPDSGQLSKDQLFQSARWRLKHL